MIGMLRAWLRQEIRRIVAEERQNVHVHFRDPMTVYEANRDAITVQLAQAANRVGRDVVLGNDVVIWGGKFPAGVGLELHDHVRIYDQCRLVIDQVGPESGIVLGERVAMNFACYIDGSGGVRIGARTILGPNVVIVSSGHRIDPDRAIQQSGKAFGRVDIGSDVWIGANAVIRMGITIGDRAVVGAGAIVTHDVAPGTAVAGNPARVLRTGPTAEAQ